MEFARVTEIRPVGALKAVIAATDVAPLFAAQGADRMEDDCYSASSNKDNRGMEDEEADEPQAESDEADLPQHENATPENQLDLFA